MMACFTRVRDNPVACGRNNQVPGAECRIFVEYNVADMAAVKSRVHLNKYLVAGGAPPFSAALPTRLASLKPRGPPRAWTH